MEAQTTPPSPPPEEPRKLFRSRRDRVIGGVCGGIARHFNIDATIVRVATVALAIAWGAGLLLYLLALLLMPEDPNEPAPEPGAGPAEGRTRTLTIVGLVVLGVILVPIAIGTAAVLGLVLVPLAALALAALLTWWLVSGERPGGTPREVLVAIGLGLVVLTACATLAIGGAWLAATGGGSVVAGLLIGAGVVLVIAAFFGGARWAILPALALALPVAFVSAAGIDLDGGVGEREYRPNTAAEVRDRYELGIGSMLVDLRYADLPPGDLPLDIEIGMGEAVLLVPEDVCVASEAEVGMGAVTVFDRESGGVDVDWDDPRTVASDTTRVVLDADVGVGHVAVRHHAIDRHDGHWHDDGDRGGEPGNEACVSGERAG